MAPTWLARQPVAHRGLHDAARGMPENSLVAFEAAVAAGWAIELDVRATRDGHAVVFHDADLSRMTGRRGAVAEASAAEIAELRLRGTAEPVPLFADVLARVGARTPILIEVKHEGAGGEAERATLAALETYDGPVAVQSFNAGTLAWFAQHAPALARGFLYSTRTGALGSGRAFLDALARIDAAAHPAFLGLDARALPVAPDKAAALRDRYTLLAWTVTSPEREREARRWCDNIIFESFRPVGPAPPGGAVV